MAQKFRVSPLVIGLTIVAFGTSAPELAVSVLASIQHAPDLAIGNVVGSNIFNVLFILGLSAAIVPLVVAQEIIRRDVPIMIFASIVLFAMCQDKNLSVIDGLVLFAGIVGYTLRCIYQGRTSVDSTETTEAQSIHKSYRPLLKVVFGLLLLVGGSKLLIIGCVGIAASLGISELVIGLTIVAAGTSLPEVATSVIAALRGERDIAVGNVVGSNIFNILCVLGLTSIVSPVGVPVDQEVLEFDLPFMIAAAIACWPIFLTGKQIARWEGIVFLFYYLFYLSYVVAVASQHTSQHMLRDSLFFIVPITCLTLLVSLWQEIKSTHR